MHILKFYSEDEHINVGSGEDISIADLARVICKVVGFDGEIVQDVSKPDGTPQKLMDGSKLKALGWRPQISFEQGLESTYRNYLASGEAA